MTGTILNVITILLGGLVGLLVGARLSPRLKETVIARHGAVHGCRWAEDVLQHPKRD